MMKNELSIMTLVWIGLFLVSLSFAGCASNERFQYDVNGQEFFQVGTSKGDPNPFIWPGGNGGSSDDDPTGENPNDEDPGCTDCFPPDDFDLCFSMRLYAYGVSSAVVELNDVRIFFPKNFHNENYLELVKEINLDEGENILEFGANLRGSPGDRLEIQILNCALDEPELLFETILIRETGKPQTETFTLP